VALVQLESSLSTDINVIMGSEDIKIYCSLTLGGKYDSKLKVYLKYHINEMALLSNNQILSEMQSKLGDFLYNVKGHLTSNPVNYYDINMTNIIYDLSIDLSYIDFVNKVHSLAREKSDLEFTNALEVKLLEN
jgi:hypothetical protein